MLPVDVNFFGHAAVASWDARAAPAFVLGAMLPDFASMIGARLGAQTDAEVARGVDLHHATDAVFHRAPVVLGLFREAEGRLRDRGVRKGPMRAAAHVGVELLLDGVLAREPGHRDAYAAGLAAEAAIVWRDGEGAARCAALLARLRGYGPPDEAGPAAGAAVARRIERALAGRTLLAPDAAEREAIAAVMDELAARVAVAAPAVLMQVRAGLATER